MFNFNMKIPEVETRDKPRCTCNANQTRHAGAITIGGMNHAQHPESTSWGRLSDGGLNPEGLALRLV
jgi:hypothetical protein